jgi:hypothetical protein
MSQSHVSIYFFLNFDIVIHVLIRTENDHPKRLTIDYFPQYSIQNNERLFEDNHNLTILLFIYKNESSWYDSNDLRILRVRI